MMSLLGFGDCFVFLYAEDDELLLWVLFPILGGIYRRQSFLVLNSLTTFRSLPGVATFIFNKLLTKVFVTDFTSPA